MARRHEAAVWTEAADDLWVAEVHVYDGPLHVRVRMTVVRLADGGLWLHSPVPLGDDDVARIDAWGAVRFLVAPNQGHHLFLADAHARWPHAAIWMSPGVIPKHPELPCAGDLFVDPPPWRDEIGTQPLRGTPWIAETVFCHHASGSLIVTDSLFHIHEEPSSFTRLFWRLFGVWRRFGTSRVFWWMTKDRAAARASWDRMLAWDFDRVIVAHGDLLETGGREAVRDAVAWI